MQALIWRNIFKDNFQGERGTIWVLGGILLLAFALRVCPLKDLTNGSLYFGEAQTMADAALPISEIAPTVVKDQGPLKFYLLHAMLYLGRGEFLLRLPALFFDLVSILLLFYLGALLFNRKTALLACFFMAVSIWHIHYATSAKNYPLYVFLILASTVFLYRAVKTQNMRDWFLFSGASIFSFYAFYPSLIILAVQVCWFFLCYGKCNHLIKRLGISLGLFAAMVAPWGHRLMVAFERKQNFGTGHWGLQGHEIWGALRDHFGGVTGPYPWGIFIFVLSFVWIFHFQKKKSQALLLLMLVVIPIFFFIFCFYVFHISIVPRYFLLIYPFFLLMSASGIASWSHWVARLAGAFVFLLPLCLYGFYQINPLSWRYIPYDYLRHDEDFAVMASLIEKNYGSLDFVAVESSPAILGIQYYLDKANKSPVVILRKNSDQDRYFMYTNPNITLYGIDGDLPLLKDLAAAGRLLVIDVGHIDNFKNGEAIISWLKSSAYRVERGHGVEFYFISPPPRISGNYKDSSEAARQRLFLESSIRRRLIYPFNRKEWALREN